ncbi:lysoplasmalogenase [Crocinitomicaceae bacterium]|jgi:uncharacterized membrane protein YhhN|nr:lysoplasmalogenase [Crocinitomicaceae bacterium]
MKGIWLIILLFIGYLVLVFFEKEDIASFIKPILVPVLLLSFYASVKNKGNYKIIGALVFSTMGDILLIFEGRPFFILGLLSFLLAHVLFVLIFRSRAGTIKLDFYTVVCSLFILSYYFFFMKFLWPHLGAMRIPVLAYAFVISGMLWMALQLLRSTSSLRWHIVLGALFFVVSDSLLSIQLFYSSFELAHFYVMLTYLLAQLLLVYGILNFRHERS